MAPGLTTYVAGTGGTAPYIYTLLAGSPGSIDFNTGLYTAPDTMPTDPKACVATIQVYDAVQGPVTGTITIANPLLLFCDILRAELALADDRVYLWDQKIFLPEDGGMAIAVSVANCKPFGNKTELDENGNAVQSVNMLALMDLDIISRSTEALFRKEEVILALNSIYAQSQQELNSFFIGKLPMGDQFVNLSAVDGAAIPYRFRISVALQYFVTKRKAVPYFDTFDEPEIVTDP